MGSTLQQKKVLAQNDIRKTVETTTDNVLEVARTK